MGVLAGVLLAVFSVPYLAGAARTWSESAVRVVQEGGDRLVSNVAKEGASERVVLGLAAAISVMVPGITAWLLILAGKGAMRLRGIAAVLTAVVGVVAFFYHPTGVALGALILGLVLAGLVIAGTGPLVVVPLAALAAVVATVYLPRLIWTNYAIEARASRNLHMALMGSFHNTWEMRWLLLVLAAVPFLLAARSALGRR